MEKSVSITDTQFRIATGVVGAVLIAGLSMVSLCGGVSGLALPPKPPPPAEPTGTSSQLLTKQSSSAVAYRDFVERDAAAAGVPIPSLEELARVLPYRVDAERHVLELGAPPIELAGVRLRAVRVEEGLALEIANATGADLAYNVVTSTIPQVRCGGSALAFNAMTVARGAAETRLECNGRDGLAIAVARVETMEVSPLSAWYLNHVPPSVVGIEARVSRGHLVPSTGRCGSTQPQTVRSGLERGEIGWRDLVDFFARHRCQTYQFPPTYRAFKSDGERPLPASAAGM